MSGHPRDSLQRLKRLNLSPIMACRRLRALTRKRKLDTIISEPQLDFYSDVIAPTLETFAQKRDGAISITEFIASNCLCEHVCARCSFVDRTRSVLSLGSVWFGLVIWTRCAQQML